MAFLLIAMLCAPAWAEPTGGTQTEEGLRMATEAAERLGLDCTGQGIFGQGHAEYHQSYRRMENKLGTDCCSDGDCRPTRAVFDGETEMWLACLNERPILIPSAVHVKDAFGLSEFASICADPIFSTLYCFVPPYSGG